MILRIHTSVSHCGRMLFFFLLASSGMSYLSIIAKANTYTSHPSYSLFPLFVSSSAHTDSAAHSTLTVDKFYEADIRLYNSLISCNDTFISTQINNSLNVLYDAFRLYGPAKVVASYNGGKDADVVMNLIRAATAKFSLDNKKTFKPKFIYFAVNDEFPDVIKHIEYQRVMLGLDIIKSPSGIVQVNKLHGLMT